LNIIKLLLAAFIFSTIFLIFFFASRIEMDVLGKFGFSDFEITEKSRINRAGVDFTRFIANKGDTIMKGEYSTNIDETQARQYIDAERFGIESLYVSTPAPYSDVITRTMECPDEFKPVFNSTNYENQDSYYYVLYANDRFVYGICSEDLVKYRAIYYLVYCKNNKDIYQMELFMNPEEFNSGFVDNLQSFGC